MITKPQTESRSPAPPVSGDIKHRNPWLAALLSFVIPGLGQLYNGQICKASDLFFLFFYLIPIGAVLLPTFFDPAGYGMITPYILVPVMQIGASIKAFFTARKRQPYRLKIYNRWWVYVLVPMVLFVLSDGFFRFMFF